MENQSCPAHHLTSHPKHTVTVGKMLVLVWVKVEVGKFRQEHASLMSAAAKGLRQDGVGTNAPPRLATYGTVSVVKDSTVTVR